MPYRFCTASPGGVPSVGSMPIVFVDLTCLASRLGSVADAPVRRLRSWQQSNTESFIELLASLWSAEKLRA